MSRRAAPPGPSCRSAAGGGAAPARSWDRTRSRTRRGCAARECVGDREAQFRAEHDVEADEIDALAAQLVEGRVDRRCRSRPRWRPHRSACPRSVLQGTPSLRPPGPANRLFPIRVALPQSPEINPRELHFVDNVLPYSTLTRLYARCDHSGAWRFRFSLCADHAGIVAACGRGRWCSRDLGTGCTARRGENMRRWMRLAAGLLAFGGLGACVTEDTAYNFEYLPPPWACAPPQPGRTSGGAGETLLPERSAGWASPAILRGEPAKLDPQQQEVVVVGVTQVAQGPLFGTLRPDAGGSRSARPGRRVRVDRWPQRCRRLSRHVTLHRGADGAAQ